jgi:hypothetical protein
LPYPYTLAAAVVLASVYVFGNKLRAGSHHRRWVSIAAGVSVATIFIDLLPEISESQAKFSTGADRGAAFFPEQAIYIAAMLGFVLFYGLEYLVAKSPSEGDRPGEDKPTEDKPNNVFFSFQIAAFAGYNGLIAYLLVHNTWHGAPSLFLYALAMAFHLLLVDHSLAEERHGLYESRGRWILAVAVIAGWAAGNLISIPEQWLARITGFVCGGVLMNTLVVELPEGRGGRLWPFLLAAAAYSLVLIVVLG